jgi:hypothetical protein
MYTRHTAKHTIIDGQYRYYKSPLAQVRITPEIGRDGRRKNRNCVCFLFYVCAHLDCRCDQVAARPAQYRTILVPYLQQQRAVCGALSNLQFVALQHDVCVARLLESPTET